MSEATRSLAILPLDNPFPIRFVPKVTVKTSASHRIVNSSMSKPSICKDMTGKIYIVTSEFITLPRYNKAPPAHLNPLAAKFVPVHRLLKLFNSLFVSLHISNNVTPPRRALNTSMNGINPLGEINNYFFLFVSSFRFYALVSSCCVVMFSVHPYVIPPGRARGCLCYLGSSFTPSSLHRLPLGFLVRRIRPSQSCEGDYVSKMIYIF